MKCFAIVDVVDVVDAVRSDEKQVAATAILILFAGCLKTNTFITSN